MADFNEMRQVMDKQPQLSISEHFGKTLQGEGKYQGSQAYFIRLGLCNLNCRWCDTPYTWDWTGQNGYAYSKAIELQRLDIDEIAAFVPADCRRVVISGGEPMVQQGALIHLCRLLRTLGHSIEIETNGTITPDASWVHLSAQCLDIGVQFNVSPKLSNSGMAREVAIVPAALTEYYHLSAIFKFVVQTDECIHEVRRLMHELNFRPEDIYLMPEGRTRDEILDKLPWLFDVCAEHGFTLTPRLHVLAYGNKRGI